MECLQKPRSAPKMVVERGFFLNRIVLSTAPRKKGAGIVGGATGGLPASAGCAAHKGRRYIFSTGC